MDALSFIFGFSVGGLLVLFGLIAYIRMHVMRFVRENKRLVDDAIREKVERMSFAKESDYVRPDGSCSKCGGFVSVDPVDGRRCISCGHCEA